MTKGNLIDLSMYRDQQHDIKVNDMTPVSEELKDAIQTLIDRLRESDPIQKSG
jgi:hypothetical protein